MAWTIGRCTTKEQLKLFESGVKYTYRTIKNMKGYFSEETLNKYVSLLSEQSGVDFSESDVYDFRRCVMPSGEVYGTKGQCKVGKQIADKSPAKKGKGGKEINTDSMMAKLKRKFLEKIGRQMSPREVAQASNILGWPIPKGQTAEDVLKKLLPKGSNVGVPVKTA